MFKSIPDRWPAVLLSCHLCDSLKTNKQKKNRGGRAAGGDSKCITPVAGHVILCMHLCASMLLKSSRHVALL